LRPVHSAAAGRFESRGTVKAVKPPLSWKCGRLFGGARQSGGSVRAVPGYGAGARHRSVRSVPRSAVAGGSGEARRRC